MCKSFLLHFKAKALKHLAKLDNNVAKTARELVAEQNNRMVLWDEPFSMSLAWFSLSLFVCQFLDLDTCHYTQIE